MSQFPDMGQPGPGPNPFASSPPGFQPPPRRSNFWLWVLLGLGGVGALVCCGCGGLMWFGWSQAMGVVEGEMVKKLNDDAAAKEHLGTVSNATFDMMASGEATQKADGNSVMVFHVEGEKGKGDVIADQKPGSQMFENAKLKLPSGEEVKLGF